MFHKMYEFPGLPVKVLSSALYKNKEDDCPFCPGDPFTPEVPLIPDVPLEPLIPDVPLEPLIPDVPLSPANINKSHSVVLIDGSSYTFVIT